MKPNELQRLERLVMLMTEWADWMKGYTMGNGWRSRSVGFESGYVSKTSDDMREESNSYVYQMIETAVDDLDDGHRSAIHRRYGITAVFRYPRGNYESLLIESHELLMDKLPRKGVNL